MAAARALEGLRILVADDDADSLDVMAELLEMNGAEVRRCRDGAQARLAMETFQPDLLISDLAMPVEDGFELIAAVRALAPERGGRVPAIAFSSVLDPAVRALALSSGYQDFLEKPVAWQDVLARAVALVSRAPGGGPAAS